MKYLCSFLIVCLIAAGLRITYIIAHATIIGKIEKSLLMFPLWGAFLFAAFCMVSLIILDKKDDIYPPHKLRNNYL